MSIETECPSCRERLGASDRASDGSGRCPKCGATLAPPPLPADQLGASEPDRSVNPYAAPQAPLGPGEAIGSSADSDRDGPAWERQGKSFRSYRATVGALVRSPNRFFLSMRRRGGTRSPLLFFCYSVMVTALAAVLVSCVVVGVWELLFPGDLILARVSRNFVGTRRGELTIRVIAAIITIFILIFTQITLLFVVAGIQHLGLIILGSGRQGFEATFRVLAYTFGALVPLESLVSIPCLGIVAFWGMLPAIYMYQTIGLTRAHESAGWKSALAAFSPVIVCAATYLVLYCAVKFLVPILRQ